MTTHIREQSVFAALADPMRRQLLENLAQGQPKTATQLAEEYPITRQGILKHLKVLEAAGLVSAAQAGREVRYSFSPAPLAQVDEWLNALNARWDQRLMRLKDLVEQTPSSAAPRRDTPSHTADT